VTWLQYLLGLPAQFPDAWAVIVGLALSWAPGLLLEQFLPKAMTPEKIKRLTLAVSVLSAFIVTTVVWRSQDKADSRSLVGVVSFFSAMCAPKVHVVAAKILDKYVPFISSVFTWDKPQGP